MMIGVSLDGGGRRCDRQSLRSATIAAVVLRPFQVGLYESVRGISSPERVAKD